MSAGEVREPWNVTERREHHRVIAVQCVAELGRGVQILDVEVTTGLPRRDVLATIRAQRRVLRLLEDSVLRDGRPA